MERKISRRVFIAGTILSSIALGIRLSNGIAMEERQTNFVPVDVTPIPQVTPEAFGIENINWPEAVVTQSSTVIQNEPLLEEIEFQEQKRFFLNLAKLSKPEPTSTPIPTPTPTLTPFPTPTPTPKPTPTEIIANLAGSFIWRGDANKPNVAITIDDGWWDESIVKVTQILRETKTKLTLFVPGQAINAYPKLWRELDSIGCKIECHSYTHRFDVAKLSVEDILDEIDRSQAVLDKVLGRHEPFSFYRPAGGAMSENIVKALKLRNLRGVIWTLSGEGTSKIATPETVTNRILSLAGNGYITLHHFLKNDADALKPIILGLRAKGLTPCRLDETV
jgi:peptidoglycan-N-acetylglucosamine deacetylase